MTLDEAEQRIAEAVAEVRAAGFDVWGWDDGAILIDHPTNTGGPSRVIEPQG